MGKAVKPRQVIVLAFFIIFPVQKQTIMPYELIEENLEAKIPFRIYKEKNTGTQVKTVLLKTDPQGQKWWSFTDLFKIPIMRVSLAQHISNLYSLGLTKKDLIDWCAEEKKLLKSEDPDKYEKMFAMILEKERIIEYTADPIKQSLALCTVYVMSDSEDIEYFDEGKSEEKLKYWLPYPSLVAFFLTWHNDHIQDYTKTLNRISKIALKLEKENRPLPVQLKA